MGEDNERIPIILVANKSDLNLQRKVPKNHVYKEWNLVSSIIETSAQS